MTAVLNVSALRAGYAGGDILKGVDLEVPAGRLVTIIGPNGCGKSTLLKTLAGLLNARGGSIELHGLPVAGLDPVARVGAGLAYVPQESNIFRSLTVAENLMLATEFMPRGGKKSPSDLPELIGIFPELEQKLTVRAGNLSGGQRQMLAFACALAFRPRLLLLDEPSAGLSPKYTTELMEKIRQVNRSGVSILMVEQNAAEALQISDTCVVMAGGRVRTVCPAAQVLSEGKLHSLYLGHAAVEA